VHAHRLVAAHAVVSDDLCSVLYSTRWPASDAVQ